MLVCELALRTGVPQREICERFTVAEIEELFAYKAIEFRTQSKEDIRAQLLSYHVVTSNLAAAGGKKAVRGIKPDAFGLVWGKEPAPVSTREELIQKFEALAAICSKDNRKRRR